MISDLVITCLNSGKKSSKVGRRKDALSVLSMYFKKGGRKEGRKNTLP